jgi:PKD repeat protein
MMVFLAFSLNTLAQNAPPPEHPDPHPSKIDAKFDSKVTACSVELTDKSKAKAGITINSWRWSFGDGDTSIVQNPTHAYKYSGRYKISLTVTGSDTAGKVYRDRKDEDVSVKGCAADSLRCRLSAKFKSVKDSNSCVINFTDESTSTSATTIVSRRWSFGDGDTSIVANPTHDYKYSGRYNVCLTITGVNAAGEKCVDRECRVITFKSCPDDSLRCRLSAKFKYVKDSNSCTVNFFDSSKVSSATTIVSRRWSFGDGDTSIVANPTHSYKYSGRYEVCLTIVGVNAAGERCVDKECHTLMFKGCAGDSLRCRLSARFKYVKDSSSCNVSFIDSSKIASSTTVTTYHWSFGDGDTSNVQNPTHAYKYSGHYKVCLTIVGVNDAGEVCRDRECHDIVLRGCPSDSLRCRLRAAFDYVADSTSVKFNDSSKIASSTTVTKWLWSFGDGSVDSVQNPSHVYSKKGSYYVCLTVTGVNAAGETCRDRECKKVNIRNKRDGIENEDMNVSLQLYPNPAKEVVNINFEMAKEGQANISVSDIQGRKLAVVKEGYFSKGIHNLNWNVSLPSGWYFITVTTDAAVEHKQMFIQK